MRLTLRLRCERLVLILRESGCTRPLWLEDGADIPEWTAGYMEGQKDAADQLAVILGNRR